MSLFSHVVEQEVEAPREWPASCSGSVAVFGFPFLSTWLWEVQVPCLLSYDVSLSLTSMCVQRLLCPLLLCGGGPLTGLHRGELWAVLEQGTGRSDIAEDVNLPFRVR